MGTRVLRPQITIANDEHRKLFALAASAGGSMASAAEVLMDELERARIVDDRKVPPDVVRIGSRLRYRTDKDEVVEGTLVYPHDADISQGRISVLTPVGAALIGLKLGQSITWEARDGRLNVLTVLSVGQPETLEA